MLYAFKTLESTDTQAARELLPQIIEGKAGREEVQAATRAALERKIGDGEEEREGQDQAVLFPAEKTPPETGTGEGPKLDKAIQALEAILSISPAARPLAKWEHARAIASEILKELRC